MIIDTHTHIYLNKKSSEKEIISKLKEDGISSIISIGIDIETSKKSIELSRQNPQLIYATVGIHPTYVGKYENKLKEAIDELEELIVENKDFVKGIGETGFDYYHIKKRGFKKESQLQEEFFKAQVFLARKHNLPLVVHSREAKVDTLRVLRELNFKKFVLHCYPEDLDFAYKVINYSSECKISFSGIVTYNEALNIQNVAANIPLDKILVETDCPFLSPQEVRGTENVPNNVKYVLQKVFKLRKENGKKETWEKFKRQIFQNSKDIFKI